MLLEFTVENFLSFKDKCTFTMEASAIKDDPAGNVVVENGYKVLRTAAVYGANSSGKSNFILALATMGKMVEESVKLNDEENLPYDPFLLSSEMEGKPTFFEIVYLNEGKRYRYGFQYTLNHIVGEWFFVKKGRSEKPLFIRNAEGIEVIENDFKEGVGLEEKTNDNRLFLSLVAQLGGEISKQIVSWFTTYNVLSGLDSKEYKLFSKLMLLKKIPCCEEAFRFFQELQLGFKKIYAQEHDFDESQLPSDMSDEIKHKVAKTLVGKKRIDIFTLHKKYNKDGEPVGEEVFDFFEKESSGTQKLVELAGPIFDSLLNGRILVVDELDAKMHPLISQHIIQLFNDPIRNPKNAQLIFTTHDTHLLASNLLRRDQIWFTEKNRYEQTDLYSMLDIVFPDGSKPRSDSNYEKNYIAGRYGAIPYILNE